MNNFLLDLLSFGAILSSILVITSKNPVVAVVFLISLFINTAGYLILIGIGFIGLSYIIIYIGAITVLFLFIIMMINIRLLDLLEIGNEYTKNFPLAILIGTLFVYEIYNVLPFTSNNVFILNLPLNILNYFNNLLSSSDFSLLSLISGQGLNAVNLEGYISPNLNSNITFNSLNLDFNLNQFIQIEILGQGLYTYGSIWLLLTSIILLLAMLSALYLSNHAS
jgi:NADH-ubiquinone oxidoreductase chain 6